MKTSEIIRERIDSKLSPYHLGTLGQQEEYMQLLDSRFLCRMFKDQPKVLDYITQALKEQGTGISLAEPKTALCGREEYRFPIDSYQVYRFFFADMMAAYFESIGD